MPLSSLTSSTRIVVVGAGRVGLALVRGLARAGMTVAGPLGRGSTAAGADLVLLAVPDREIAAAAGLIPGDILVGHCSASTPLDVLMPHERFLLHPLASVSSPDASLDGAYAAVAGSTPRGLEAAEGLAHALGLHPIRVPEADRALYHASASLAANALVTLLWDAERTAASIGIPREALVPLATGALDAWRTRGAAAALTGPVARGDDATVARQRDAVAARHPELLRMWDAMTERMRMLAGREKNP